MWRRPAPGRPDLESSHPFRFTKDGGSPRGLASHNEHFMAYRPIPRYHAKMPDHKTPRYLVLTELFLPTKGGTAVWFDEVYRRLGDRTTHILTAAVPGDAEHDRDHPNTIHRLNLAHHPRLHPSSLPAYLRLFLRGLRLGFAQRFDAVHAGSVLPEGLVARLIWRPVVIYAHGEEISTT